MTVFKVSVKGGFMVQAASMAEATRIVNRAVDVPGLQVNIKETKILPADHTTEDSETNG